MASLSKRTTVSLQKIVDLLHRNGFVLVATYVSSKRDSEKSSKRGKSSGTPTPEREVKFLQVKTPKYQKTFIISIPSRYSVKNTLDTHRRFDIGKFGDVPSKQLDFLTELKGSRLECDLVAISATTVYLYRNAGTSEGYLIGESAIAGLVNRSSETEDPDGGDEIERLAREVKTLSKNLGLDAGDSDEELSPEDLKKMKVFGKTSGVVFENDGDGETDDELTELYEGDFEADDDQGSEASDAPPEDGAEDDESSEGSVLEIPASKIRTHHNSEDEADGEDEDETPIDSGETESPVDLDDDGNPIEVTTAFAQTPADQEKNHRQSSRSARRERRRKTKRLVADNSLPLHIEESDLEIGIIYVSVDLSTFYSRVSAVEIFETEILKTYDTLDTNEMEMRDLRSKEIGELASKISEKVKNEMEMFRAADLKIKSQIIRLSETMKRLDALSEKIDLNPSKFSREKVRVGGMRDLSKNTFEEMNLRGLRLRDIANDTLGHYLTCLEDMINFQPDFGFEADADGKNPTADDDSD